MVLGMTDRRPNSRWQKNPKTTYQGRINKYVILGLRCAKDLLLDTTIVYYSLLSSLNSTRPLGNSACRIRPYILIPQGTEITCFMSIVTIDSILCIIKLSEAWIVSMIMFWRPYRKQLRSSGHIFPSISDLLLPVFSFLTIKSKASLLNTNCYDYSPVSYI